MEVLHQEERVLSKEEAAEFYKQHEGSVIFYLFPIASTIFFYYIGSLRRINRIHVQV